MSSTDDKLKGAVAGFLLGDSLGAPFGGVKGGHIRQLAGGWVDDYLKDPVLFPDRPEKNHLAGVHTIAGQQFLAVLAGASEDNSGQHPAARCASRLRELAEGEETPSALGALRAPGKPLRRAIARWSEEYPWEPEDHFAKTEPSEGCSSAAFGAAVGLISDGNAIDYARLTHTREAPLIAAVVIAEATRLLLAQNNPKKIDAAEILRQLIATACEAEDALRDGEVGALWRENGWGYPVARFSNCLSPVASLLRTGDDALAEKTIIAQAAEFSPTQSIAQVQHGFAPVMVPWVLYRALGPMAPVMAVEDAINRGGDTPLAAALIGALIGARHGIEQFAPHWMERCRALQVGLALAVSPGAAVVDKWIAEERRWTSEEEAMRAPLRAEAEKRRAAAPPKKKKAPEQKVEFEQGSLPFAPPPQVWLAQKGDELAPWEKQKLKSERGRKRIGWKEERREKKKQQE